jgi:hypothetical protein
MATIKRTLFTGWYFMRWLRLVFGMLFGIEAIKTNYTFMGFAAAFFLFMAIFNTGCCGSAGCAIHYKKSKEDKME